jgi:hypothetical protein
MTTKQAVDRGLKIRAQINTLTKELEAIEAHLERAALNGEQIPLEDEDLEGRQFLARGTEKVIPVVLTSDLLIKSFADGSPVHKAINLYCSVANLPKFFKPMKTWKTVIDSAKRFRAHAAEILGPGMAGNFIDACKARDKHGVPKSHTKIHWDRARDKGAA